MTLHSNCTVSFNKSSCSIQGPSMKSPLVIGRAEEGLYFLCPKCLQNPTVSNITTSCSSCKSCADNCSSYIFTNISSVKQQGVPFLNKQRLSTKCCPNITTLSDNKCLPVTSINSSLTVVHDHGCTRNDMDILWHNRLGHVTFIKMRTISTIPVIFSPKQPFLCFVCPMARQERLPFKPRTFLSTHIFELVHVDL